MTARWNTETIYKLFSTDDCSVWRQVVQTVVPIDGHKPSWDPSWELSWRGPVWKTTAGIILASPRPFLSTGEKVPTRKEEQGWLSHGDDAHIDHRTASRFRRGRLPIEGRLDLHGLSQARAHTALRRFVNTAWQASLRSILVITGKGNRADDGVGILRSSVPLWLNEPDLRPKVLSFTYAQPRDGGEGALYLLIRRHRVGSVA